MSLIPRLFYLAALGLSTGTAMAQSVTAPALKDGDSWVYSVTEERNVAGTLSSSTRKWENSIVRAGAKSISVSAKPADSNMPAKEISKGVDWSFAKNIGGKSTVTSQPYDFPMSQGKTWKIDYVNDNPDPRTKSEKITKQYTVIGWDDVKVPAGTFHALKIEMEGEWAKEFNKIGPSITAKVVSGEAGAAAVAQSLNAGTPKPASGKLYQALWYVPELKTYVKSITEDYQSGGLLNHRVTEELETSKVN